MEETGCERVSELRTRDGGDHLADLQPVEDSGLSGAVQTQDEDPHFPGAEQAGEQAGEEATCRHSGGDGAPRITTGTTWSTAHRSRDQCGSVWTSPSADWFSRSGGGGGVGGGGGGGGGVLGM